MAKKLFISEQYIKDNTNLPVNIDVKYLTPNIAFAQDSFIQNILGSKLYNSLQLSYSGNTMNPDEVALVELIKPALAYRAAEMSLPFIHIQIRNAGTVLLNSDNGTVQSSLGDMKYLRSIFEERALLYESQITNYLMFNGDKYPDYIAPDAKGILPSRTQEIGVDLYLRTLGANYHGTMCGCGDENCFGGCGFYVN